MKNVALIGVLALGAGCAPVPASLSLSPAADKVHEVTPLALPSVEVLDKAGTAVASHEAISWSVSPEEVAKLGDDGATVVPLADGTATVTANLGTISASWTLNVALPDAVNIAGAEGGALSLAPTGSAMLTASVVDNGQAVESLVVTWSSSDPAVATVADGSVMAVAAGTSSVTATWGALSSTVVVTVADPAVAEGVEAGVPAGDTVVQ